MAWDALQREALHAMGLQPLRHVPVGDAPAELAPALLAALARAARVAPEHLPAITAAMAVDTAAGKRALWPALRTLRRGH